ncbi:MAG: dinitrogenase iron-molybdenum cofactor [Caldiserica bacterium CG_4_8_14_3_um_filter_35_18]|nr:dinitrogenase iron-molybdenum cofactor [Caldisericota bacterium]PIX28597.1 MAG: dinitrogenase iron-molybdenum cofactor [Caldiserica bacterium CG_4_8_14_3_um_filter_35_18]
MKICFTADEANGIESTVSYHFGHCPYYVIVDVDGNVVKSVESIPNPMAEGHSPGDLPSYMKEKGIDTIITGGMGERAQEFFKSYNIEAITGTYGKVKDVLEEYLHGEVKYTEKAEHQCEKEENKDLRMLKEEVADLRRQIADLKNLIKEIKEKK